MRDEDLNELREMWTSAPGRFELHGIEATGGLIPFDTQWQQFVLIEDDELAKSVIDRMLDSGVPVIRVPAPCVVHPCQQHPIRYSLCAHHLAQYEADQERRVEKGLTGLTPESWAEVRRRLRKRP